MNHLPRKASFAHALALVRTALFVPTAIVFFVLYTLLSSWVLLLPPERCRPMLNGWARGHLALARVLLGQRVRVIGRDNLPYGPAIVAAKHHAAWETIALLPIVPRGVVIIKRELTKIPLYGHFALFFGMIPVDRSAGMAAMKGLAKAGKAAMARNAQLIIFPEGTRQAVGAPPAYKPGAMFLYETLGVPLVPVALNSGCLYPRDRFARYPGTITVSILPPIAEGLPRPEIRQRMMRAIEDETARLVAACAGPDR